VLTRDLLLFTLRKGRIRPRFVDRADGALLEAARDLVDIAARAPGEPKKDIDAAMGGRAMIHPRPKVARGLVKLLQDRMEVAEPGDAALELRRAAFAASMAALEAADPDEAFTQHERRLEAALGRPLEEVRAALHADLPDARPVESFEPISAEALIDRYNLALAQGLVLYARRVELEVGRPERPEVRRLLRWMRFCRLVAHVEAGEDGCRLGVEGPAALFEGAKGYGLQLASFLAAVPMLGTWRLEAEVELPRRPAATLELTGADPLASTFSGGSGYVPEEVRAVLERARIPGWTVDLAPAPRTMGATGLAVPDFALVPERGAPLVVELFHRWHRGALERRLEELEASPDPSFRLGVDRALAKDPEVAARIEAHPQAFLFRGFPSARALARLAEAAAAS
jgi:hypothetical protein